MKAGGLIIPPLVLHLVRNIFVYFNGARVHARFLKQVSLVALIFLMTFNKKKKKPYNYSSDGESISRCIFASLSNQRACSCDIRSVGG